MRHLVSILCCLALLAAAPLAAQKPPSPQQRREALRPVYNSLQTDPEFLRFKKEMANHSKDPALRDNLLKFLPLSPLDYLALDMEARHYEIPVPRQVQEAHDRWIRFHEATARGLFGDAHVDSRLSGWVDEGKVPGGPIKNIASAATVDPNRNVAATDVPGPDEYQGEIQVAVNPNNPNQLVAASNTWDWLLPCGSTVAIFNSGDGGVTWNYTCAPPSTSYSGFPVCDETQFLFEFGADPAVAWDDQNRAYVNYMLICSDGLFYAVYAMAVTRSTDGGATWNSQGVVVNSWNDSDLEDKNFYAIDNTPTSPYYGRHYTCWDRNNNEKLAYSTNGGASWTEVDLPASPVGGIDLACEMAVEDNGTVHVIFDSLTCTGPTRTDEAMVYTKSTNGGVTWSSPVVVRDFNLAGFSNLNCPDPQDDRCINPFGAIGVDNSGGACDGTLYASFTDFSSGQNVNDSDVWVSRSTNGGATWSSPVKVNNDGLAGRAQFHPFLQVDQSNGGVVVAWHDARNDGGNDAVDFYVARSTDCGLGFGPNVQASQPSAELNNATISRSDQNSNDNLGYNPNQYGEYMGLDVLNGKAYVAWSDTRHYFPGSTTEPQKANLGFAKVDFLAGGNPVCGNNVKEVGESCDGTDLGGQTCASQGFTSGSLSCNATCSAFNVSNCVLTTFTSTFTSIAADDGYLLESTETANAAGTAVSNDATTAGLRLGDETKDKQYRSFLSFDTSALPDSGIQLLTAKLRLRRVTVVGTNPFTNFGAARADLRTGTFNNAALELADWGTAASANNVCTLSNAAANGDWSECTLDAAGLAALNRTGLTQVRIFFGLDDDDDNKTDYIGYYAGNAADPASRPQLVVTYQ
jgi:hypothetical protein